MAINNILDELKKMKEEQEQEFESSVISGTIIKLLEIEKQALYGAPRGKNQRQEDIILKGLKKYKEMRNADKKN